MYSLKIPVELISYYPRYCPLKILCLKKSLRTYVLFISGQMQTPSLSLFIFIHLKIIEHLKKSKWF